MCTEPRDAGSVDGLSFWRILVYGLTVMKAAKAEIAALGRAGIVRVEVGDDHCNSSGGGDDWVSRYVPQEYSGLSGLLAPIGFQYCSNLWFSQTVPENQYQVR